MIHRVDSGIKLKRNKQPVERDNEQTTADIPEIKPKSSQSQAQDPNARIDVGALKQEWSDMFSKLEQEYKLKLEEQQKLNDEKLKSLREDIKQSMLDQQDKLMLIKQQEKNEVPAPVGFRRILLRI